MSLPIIQPEIFFAAILGIVTLFMIFSSVAVELVALFGLALITILGFVRPDEAFSGFSSVTVVTMVAMFMVAAGLRTSGVTELVAVSICKYLGKKTFVIVVAVMLLGALVSAGMNNVAAVAVTLPAVMLIAQRTEIAPAKLLMPLTFAVVLGGTMTAVGSTPNLVMIDIMQANNIMPFQFLSYLPFGVILVVVGIIFIATIGIRILPLRRSDWRKDRTAADYERLYNLTDRVFGLSIPKNSLLSGLNLEQLRFNSILGAQVLAIRRDNQKILYPPPNTAIYSEDLLIVQGRKERVKALLLFTGATVASSPLALKDNYVFCRVKIADTSLTNLTLNDLDFRNKYKMCVIAIEREKQTIVSHLARQTLKVGDTLELIGSNEAYETLRTNPDFQILSQGSNSIVSHNIFLLNLPKQSGLAGLTIKAARISELTGLQVLGINQTGGLLPIIDGQELLPEQAQLVVVGDPTELNSLNILCELKLESDQVSYPHELANMAMAELSLAPRSRVIGKTLVEIDFREKYDFQVMAIWHKGRPRRSNLSNIKLEFGDALLVHGPRDKLSVLKDENDFVFLSSDNLPPFHLFKASIAILAFAFITLASIVGFLPVHIAAVIGALLVILSGGLKMEEAYHEINWRIVFVVAALLPFGLAFERSGLLETIGMFATETLGQHSFWTTVIIVSIATSFFSQITDGIVAVLLITPVAIQLAEKLHGDVRLILMAVAISASIAFITPFSHKANLLVMGAGGYRVSDYARLGVPLTIVSFLALWGSLYFLGVQ